MRRHPAGVARDVTGLSRSVQLLRAFRVEQTDPDRFYGALAADSAALVAAYTPMAGRLVVDVGAGRPHFRTAFRAAGARYVSVDDDVSALPRTTGVLRGRGEQLPLRDGSADVCFSSNLLEHVAAPFTVAEEIVRVTRPGGLVVLGYTNWLSPWGGHETSPWHYAGGERAARRYARRHGHPPKNRFGTTLFPLSVAAVLGWARAHPELRVIDARPRYLPPWARPLTRVPGVREVLTWNLLLVAWRREGARGGARLTRV